MLDQQDRPIDVLTLDGLVEKFNRLSYSPQINHTVKAQEMLEIATQLAEMRDNVPVKLRGEYTDTVHRLSDSFDEHMDATKEEYKGAYDLVGVKFANIDLKF